MTEAERRCPQCGETRAQISAERSEQLDYVPATLFVVEHVRCTYACPHCEGQVVTAGKPAQPIPKGLPGPGLLAHVITESMPIIFHSIARNAAWPGKVELSRSTLCDWMAGAPKSRAALRPDEDIGPVVRHDSHRRHVGEAADSERKIKALARLWIYFGDHLYPYNVFDFTRSHKRDGPSLFLRVFAVICRLMPSAATTASTRAATSWRWVATPTPAASSSSAEDGPNEASTALAYYRQLYAIEKQIKAELAKLPEDANEPTRAAIRLQVRRSGRCQFGRASRVAEGGATAGAPKSPMGGRSVT
ncbi:IS66 family transposase zinc-finger binding domain-containing protein [Singulisphaera sp. Ch08]|uniref:IS66 family transposase zinc-finger binding domain-containing protein n=1 Tax=Singulisphaera sp. Ch08 TaxID=3120278 RepID=A0AAU7CDG0_9BACT